MAFDWEGYSWDGPHPSPSKLQPASGLYSVWTHDGKDWRLLDLGETNDVQQRVTYHERKLQWEMVKSGDVYFAAAYTQDLDDDARKEAARQLREKFKPPCGRQV